jgi:IS4 transposase
VYDLARGGFSYLELTDKHGAESLLRCEPVTNEVLIADRGYAKARELRACLDASGPQQRDFIVRVGWKALVLRDQDGKPFSLIQHLQDMPIDAGLREWAVQAVTGSAKQPTLLPMRLIVVPLPADKVAAKRLKLQQKASKRQSILDPHSVLAAGFLVLATSLPAEIPAAEIAAAYRLRWQIELAIKRLKSLLHIDRLPTKTADGSHAWLLAHLILALLIEDTCQELLESSP